MNLDIMLGNWKLARGMMRSHWARLAADELDEMKGDYEQLCGHIQKAYGLSREQVAYDFSPSRGVQRSCG